MAVNFFERIIKSLRRRLAYFVFGTLLVWPLFHIIIVNTTKLSTWRLFGWGMYATPTPEEQSRLCIVILNADQKFATDLAAIHETVTKLNKNPENLCANIFAYKNNELERILHAAICKNKDARKNIDYFMNFGSIHHLKKLMSLVLQSTNHLQSDAILFVTRQRYNLFKQQAYNESDVYDMIHDDMRYRGKITSMGDQDEGRDF